MKFGMLEVRENEISLRKCSGGAAQLRTFRGTLISLQRNKLKASTDSALWSLALDLHATDTRC